MKIARTGLSLAAGYVMIGAAVILAQAALARLFEPACNGTVEHALREDSTLSRVARWLPALYDNVIAGEMTTRDYLLGGYRCVETPAIAFDSFGPLFGGLPANESISKMMDKAAGSTPSSATPGSRATELLNRSEVRTLEPIEGITLQVRADWVQRDTTDLQKQINATLQTGGDSQLAQVREYLGPERTTEWSAKIRLQTLGAIRLAGGELLTLEAMQDSVNLRKLADAMVKADFRILEQAGYKEAVLAASSEDVLEGRRAIERVLRAVDAGGRTWESRATYIATSGRIVQLMLIFRKTPLTTHMEALELARTSLRIRD